MQRLYRRGEDPKIPRSARTQSYQSVTRRMCEACGHQKIIAYPVLRSKSPWGLLSGLSRFEDTAFIRVTAPTSPGLAAGVYELARRPQCKRHRRHDKPGQTYLPSHHPALGAALFFDIRKLGASAGIELNASASRSRCSPTCKMRMGNPFRVHGYGHVISVMSTRQRSRSLRKTGPELSPGAKATESASATNHEALMIDGR
jgi:hypothetical protein